MRVPKNPGKNVIVCRYERVHKSFSHYRLHYFTFMLLERQPLRYYRQRSLFTVQFQSNVTQDDKPTLESKTIYGGEISLSLSDYKMLDSSITKLLKALSELEYDTSGHNRGYAMALLKLMKKHCYFKYHEHVELEKILKNWDEIEQTKAHLKELGD